MLYIHTFLNIKADSCVTPLKYPIFISWIFALLVDLMYLD